MEFTNSSGDSFNLVANIKINPLSQKVIRQDLESLSKKSVIETKVKVDGKDAIKQVTTFVDSTKKKLITVEKYFESTLNKINLGNGKFKLEYGMGNEIENKFRIKSMKDQTESLKTLTTETNKYITTTGKMVTVDEQIMNDGTKLTTFTTEYKNSLGELVKEISVYNNANKQVGETITTISQDLSTVTTSIKKYKDAQGRVVTETKELNSAKDGTVKRIIEETDAQGRLVTTTETLLVRKGKELSDTKKATKVIEDDTIAREKNKQAIEEQAQKTLKMNNTFTDFISTMGKVIKFQLITKIITGFTQAVTQSVEIVKDFDSALTEFKKVSDLSGESLDSYTRKLGELGETVARTRTEMVQASTEFKKSGYSDDESAKLAQMASLYQNIADEELTAGESASFIIAQLKAFSAELEQVGDEGEQALYIIDALNEVSNNYAVSSSDLSMSLGKVSATLASNNVSFSESLG